MIIKLLVPKTFCCLSFLGTNEITIDEIGEINDHIQAGSRSSMQTSSWVWVKMKPLGDKIAVTIIATGFCVEQQAEIVNVEPKKIIHTLEGEQKAVQNLTQQILMHNAISTEAPISSTSCCCFENCN